MHTLSVTPLPLFGSAVVPNCAHYRWKQKYGGLEVSEAKRRESLDQENERLKRMVADLSLDKQMLEEIVGKKW